MITLTFLRTWFRWAFGTGLIVLITCVGVTDLWWRVGITAAALAVFALITAGLVGDWRRSRHGGAGYHYAIHDRDRD